MMHDPVVCCKVQLPMNGWIQILFMVTFGICQHILSLNGLFLCHFTWNFYAIQAHDDIPQAIILADC
jgi:hypothetical protein